MFTPVIMAGGSGTRLWPLSRGNFPKQFLPLTGRHTMLQQTLLRLSGLQHSTPLLICNEDHRFIAAEQIRQLGNGKADILLEPAGRNTAPAIALAALRAKQQGHAEAVLLVLAADHVINNTPAFQQAVEQALPLAQGGQLVTFGIVPSSAETGYGYIKRGEKSGNAYRVDSFIEKPDLSTAEFYLQSGEYYWNSGMFMFRADIYLQQLQKFRPDIYAACEAAMTEQVADLEFVRVNKTAFEACPSDSIDYAVMEKTEHAVAVPLDAGWNDVGGFAALWQVSAKDSDGNVLCGDVLALDSENSYVRSDDKLVAAIGVKDLVVISTKDAVMVAHKDQAQQVKQIVNQLAQMGRSEAVFHREVYRPWGKYDSVDCAERFQVKRITVKPGAKLSVQMHHHRAEHWIVVSGTARVTIDGKEQYVTENQSVYIPITAVHALENPGKVPLELIEVQSGAYLGEDDIVRFEDRYGRA
ncbi:mannose-1-phosphate guanylyltransferase/mannose-6-phosphate isomerase [Rheinheimera aquimaris]|jgi:mannose-1-phosphate guanylyltransferase/mannose-6-phosphate isomerase|uniref:mannose-1-phosphate guanylyltransferase/mannose-6-phosphate isomerase n=1 Tax=Rheinheimera aquimaris TaxID=412437 RepID=UPI000E84948E|nr:mannose-1-phosphate guanylyltransferase/mannose-6-phosphate isomerase [Rheinheimera aquimaris]MCD1599490.1 mannose-1-phosphate guanylyltransferase/mannose-6-phosphate isomerase [Rheinheimera aquimaris]HBN90762.1 mannose-1-phosphate guanylyltransferase/mannose-6-phosphate isomerase [Rheinheimera sp.]|tara:strand:- start:3634 stop:5040 length:1407 start_codon:yes stop_codon:yes gene_type:complete